MRIDELSNLATIGGFLIAMGVAFVSITAWVTRYFLSGIKSDVSEIKAEIHPNGGSSIKDQVTAMALQVDSITGEVDNLKQVQRDHINFHMAEGGRR